MTSPFFVAAHWSAGYISFMLGLRAAEHFHVHNKKHKIHVLLIIVQKEERSYVESSTASVAEGFVKLEFQSEAH